MGQRVPNRRGDAPAIDALHPQAGRLLRTDAAQMSQLNHAMTKGLIAVDLGRIIHVRELS